MKDGIVGSTLGGSEVGSFWRVFFWAAALFNFVIGLAGMLAPVPTIDQRIIGLLVFSFGVVFAFVARDPKRYAKMLWAGFISKLGVAGLMAPYVLSGESGVLGWTILITDVIFALGFLAFLLGIDDDT